MALRALYDVPAPAKLNLFLHVIGRRPDGYHLLQSVFVPIDWCDTLHLDLRDDGRLVRHDLGDPLPPDDLCLRAARALQTASGTPLGVDISILKRVPSGAGMGGGSSDAASTLLALNRLWGLRWSLDRLSAMALHLGADVPFFLGPGPALVEGIGERLTPIVMEPGWFAVIKPPATLETRAIFQSPLLSMGDALDAADILEGFAEAQSQHRDEAAGRTSTQGGGGLYGRNDLQAAAEAICPEVQNASRWLQGHFGSGRMTGSGSAVFAQAGHGERPVRGLPAQLPGGWTGRMCRSLASHPLASWAE